MECHVVHRSAPFNSTPHWSVSAMLRRLLLVSSVRGYHCEHSCTQNTQRQKAHSRFTLGKGTAAARESLGEVRSVFTFYCDCTVAAVYLETVPPMHTVRVVFCTVTTYDTF